MLPGAIVTVLAFARNAWMRETITQEKYAVSSITVFICLGVITISWQQ